MKTPPYIQKTNVKIALIIVVIILIWIAAGALLKTGSQDSPVSDRQTMQSIRFDTVHAKPHIKNITLTGVTDEFRRIDVRAEVTGKVLEIPAEEGAFVKEGDVILQIEPRGLAARLKEANALVQQRKIEYKTAKELALKGLESQNRLAQSSALLEEAEARRIQARIDLDNATIRAPFDGVLEIINVEIGTLVGPNIRQGEGTDSDGSTIATFIDVNPIKVNGELSERYIREVSQGQPARVRMLDGEIHTGTLSYISHMARPETRTFPLEAKIANTDQSIRSGVTASLIIPLAEKTGHAIPTSSLALNEQDVTGIKYLENLRKEQGKTLAEVGFVPVEIFDYVGNKLIALGLPDPLQLITVGHSFVRAGDTVIAIQDAQRDD